MDQLIKRRTDNAMPSPNSRTDTKQRRNETMATFETCIDCNIYDNVDQVDTFMRPFGDDAWICDMDAEARGIDA